MNGSKPALVLGLCPHCLTSSRLGNGYKYWYSQGNPDRKSLRRQILLDNFSGKALIKTNARNVLNLSRGLPLNSYHADGWEASLPISKRQKKYEKAADKLARRKRVDMRMVDELLTTVADFRQEGISVYGYRPPSNRHIRYVEDQFSGLDFHDFARRFNGAGGSWLKVNEQAYATYDGIHMDYRTAIRFSRHLGEVLRNEFKLK
ncbi:MAG: hypothetical protein KJ720_17130 [Proteobacteria bacterium]|nr:hypothetical protein [Pseudomonadota bacterium]MBU1450995.1 hypothetical protein [Pseudomonadota bacterium]MBU2516436.1 hypothetical protein [Pseudomonadota bacterium]